MKVQSYGLDVGSMAALPAGHRREVLLPAAHSALAACFWIVVVAVIPAGINYIKYKWPLGPAAMLGLCAGHLLGGAAVVLLWKRNDPFAVLSRVGEFFARPGNIVVLISGAMLARVVWVLLVPTSAVSDAIVYNGLADDLLSGRVYGTPHGKAYWAPGLPLWLAGLYRIFGVSTIIPKLASIALAASSEWCAWRWLRRYTSARTAALGLLLLVLWPSRLFHLDIISYDELATACILLSLVVMPDVRRVPTSSWRWLVAGLLLGYGCLVRPPLILVPVAVAGWLFLERLSWLRSAKAMLCVTAGMSILIVPWARRNQRVLGRAVPLTTNSGVNFLIGFDRQSEGDFSHRGYERAQALAGAGADELQVSRKCFELAWNEIQADPWAAIKRVLITKPMHYLGSDNALNRLEAYEAVWPDSTWLPPTIKAGALLLCNAFYFLMMLCPLILLSNIRSVMQRNPAAALCFMIFTSGLVVHLIFNAQPRYHLIYLPFWTLCLAIMLQERLQIPAAPSH